MIFNQHVIKKLIVVFLTSTIFLSGIFYLYSFRYWPFCTGTNVPAFLGTTFGMSLPETKRALKQHGTILVNRSKFDNLRQLQSPSSFFYIPKEKDFIFLSDRLLQHDYEYWYMPAVEMFDSAVEARFQFYQKKLSVVEVNIFPLNKKKSPDIIKKISSVLKEKYSSFHMEPSKEVPGAYSLIFDSTSSKIKFWVNLSKPDSPFLILYIIYKKSQFHDEADLKDREAVAFTSLSN